MLLDPRSIQWLLASGAAVLVFGVVIWLAASGLFENPIFVAVLLGVANALLLAGGWALIRLTRYQLAGRAVTLLACLLMPLNLWFYNSQGSDNGQGRDHLWLAALVCCVLYAVSASLLRDPMLVFVFVGGVALTGLLMLADQFGTRIFWEASAPAMFLVCLGLVCIHVERASRTARVRFPTTVRPGVLLVRPSRAGRRPAARPRRAADWRPIAT